MEPFDIFLIVVAVAAVIRGFTVGIISRVGSLVGIIAAIIAARIFGPAVSDWCRSAMPDHDTIAVAVAYAGIMLAVYLGVRLLTRLIRGAVHTLRLGIFDRIGGALFSLLEWMFAISVVINIYVAVDSGAKPIFEGGWHGIRTAVLDLAPAVAGYLQALAAS